MMNQQEEGMEAQAMSQIQEVMASHEEALVIVVDPSKDESEESTVSVYSKLRDGGTLSPCLANILQNLLKTHDPECSGITNSASIGA